MKKQYHIQIKESFFPYYYSDWEEMDNQTRIKKSREFMQKLGDALSQGKNVITPDIAKSHQS